jgi:hypothetical protein
MMPGLSGPTHIVGYNSNITTTIVPIHECSSSATAHPYRTRRTRLG